MTDRDLLLEALVILDGLKPCADFQPEMIVTGAALNDLFRLFTEKITLAQSFIMEVCDGFTD